ncbi:MAG: hypothetical protein AB7N71_02640, partial [Phycisphaerae bacterium]
MRFFALCVSVLFVPLASGQMRGELQQPGAIQILKNFDFLERPLGNYEEMPMFWTRLSGMGLPRFSDTQFDFEIGHLAPPSVRFDLRGANIAMEYTRNDIPVEADGDYRAVAWVRVEDLESARAM